MLYRGDLLCSSFLQISQAAPSTLLNFPSTWGGRVSASKVQLPTPQVTYLGLTMTLIHKAITLDKKCLTLTLRLHHKGQDHILPKVAGFLHFWILLSPFFFARYVRWPMAST